MADKKEIRRQHLRRLVNDHEGMNNLAKKLGLTKGAYISQLLTNPPTRGMSEKTARKWERMLNLQEGWFDGEGSALANQATAAETDLLHQVIHTVADALHSAKVTLRPVKLADLIVMQYADALRSGNTDHKRIKKIAELLKN